MTATQQLTLLIDGDPGYDEARTVWNAMVDRRPAAIARCHDTAEVVAAVRYARDHDLEIAVRCGGHNIAGLAVPEGGLMIDLTPMNEVRVDPERQVAWIQGGALLGELDRAAQEYGLATTAGNVSHTGVGGLTLGGGMGWLARQFGLACDNVISYELVTAAGEVVTASATENAELFWGLRGGGGNFGIVTAFEFRLHQVGTRTLVTEFTYAWDEAFAVLRGWRDLNASAPRQATFTASVRGEELTVGFVWVGDPAEGAELDPGLPFARDNSCREHRRDALPDLAEPRRQHPGPPVPSLLEGSLLQVPARRGDPRAAPQPRHRRQLAGVRRRDLRSTG